MARVFVSQDNYGRWRFSRTDPQGNVIGDTSIAFTSRTEAADAARAHFPDDEVVMDGVTTGAEKPLPMPVAAAEPAPDEAMT
jgi:hypothetical protein